MIQLAKFLNKLTVYISAVILCVVLVGIGTALAEPRALGVSAPLSGGGAGWGNDFKNVLTFANEKLAPGQYKLIFEDDRCENKSALSVAQKLSSVDKVKEVFIFCGQVAMATARIYRGAGITMMAPLATPSRISELGVFRTGLNDALASKELASYIARNHKSVSVLTEEDDYAVAFQNDFLKAAKELSLNASYETYLPQEIDFRPLLLRLKSARVEALFLNTQAEQALATLVKQLNELQFFPRLYGAYLPGSSGFLKLGGKFAEGLVFVDFPTAEEFLTPDGKALYSEYVTRFGPLRGWSFTFPAAFEGFRVIHLGLKNGGGLEQFLQEGKFEGVFGPYTFNKNGDVIGPKHVLRVIHGGVAEQLVSGDNKWR